MIWIDERHANIFKFTHISSFITRFLKGLFRLSMDRSLARDEAKDEIDKVLVAVGEGAKAALSAYEYLLTDL